MIKRYGTDQMMYIDGCKEKMTQSIIDLWNDPNSIYNSPNYGQFSKMEPNKVEQKIVDMNIEGVKYTGNFNHWITFKDNYRKNPDFIITPFSKTKKVIEIFSGKGFYHTEEELEWMLKSYNELDIKCLFFWDYEIKNKNLQQIKQQIINFINT